MTKVNKKAKTVYLKSKSDKEFFLIHGYTGSPTDFNGFAKYLHKRFNANVKVIRLIGHGETIESLDNVYYKDFLKQIETEIKKDLKKGRKIVVGGYSLGGFFALEIASKYPVVGVFHVATPYSLRFPLNVPGIEILTIFGKYWNKSKFAKRIIPKEHFSYEYFHKNGINIIKESKTRMHSYIKNIKVPYLCIHLKKDSVSKSKAIKKIENQVKSEIRSTRILDQQRHNPFFSESKQEVFKELGDFFEKAQVFKEKRNIEIWQLNPELIQN